MGLSHHRLSPLGGQDEYTVNGERRRCPYAGRAFAVTIKFPPTYPFKCPEVRRGSISCVGHMQDVGRPTSRCRSGRESSITRT